MTYIEQSLLGLRDANHGSTPYQVRRGTLTNQSEMNITRTRAFIPKPSSCILRISMNMPGADWVLKLANAVWDAVTTTFQRLTGKPMRGFRETSIFFDKLPRRSNYLTCHTPWRVESGLVTPMRGCSYSHIINEGAGCLFTQSYIKEDRK